MPFVMAHPDSEATRAFKELAHRCKEYVGFKEIEGTIELEKFPYHFKKREARR
jgi:MinD-like ATPase involved in chromosome partitioning or flagellar assembly